MTDDEVKILNYCILHIELLKDCDLDFIKTMQHRADNNFYPLVLSIKQRGQLIRIWNKIIDLVAN
jgi:hypothetical protein